jgi:sugar lactone lactonase YvrE
MKPAVQWAVKSLLTWMAVLALLAAGFALRYARVQGVFTSITPVLPSNCRTIANGLSGASDFEIDALHNALLISARDGIYFLKLGDLTAAPVKLDGAPAIFHPGGISLLRNPDGSEVLTVIDHKPNGRALIEGYSVISDGETAKLTAQTAVQGRSLVSPNSITATAADHFYVTNDHVTTSALGRFAEDYLIWPHADIILNGTSGLRIAAQRIAFPSGILARHGYLYVAAANERRIIALNIEDFTGNLSEIGAIALPARLGNISMDTSGNLIVAGQSKPGASQVFRVRIDDKGAPVSFETIFSDDGHTLKGASAAAMWNGQLFISAAAGSKMLACMLK